MLEDLPGGEILEPVVVLMEAERRCRRRIPFQIGIEILVDELRHWPTLSFARLPAPTNAHDSQQCREANETSHSNILPSEEAYLTVRLSGCPDCVKNRREPNEA